MDKEDLERELEKAEKGCVITVVNQSSLPLNFDGSKHPHGKFKAKPPKTIISRETASFSLEGRRSIEASVKFRWGRGRLELFWNMPEQGDPKIFYRVAPQLKNKLFVYIPSAVFGKITKFIFLVDEKPVAPTSQDQSSHSNPDTNEDLSSENLSDVEHDGMNRTSSNGDIAPSPKSIFDPSQPKAPTVSDSKDDEDEAKGMPSDPNSYGFSSDEEDEHEPKKIHVVIKPKSDVPVDILVTPVIGIGPPVSAPPGGGGGRRRANTNTKIKETGLFGDLNEQLFQQTSNTPVLSHSHAHSSPPRERRLDFSAENERNKLPAYSSVRSSFDELMTINFPINSSPQLVAPPHLSTPPMTPPQSNSLSGSTFSFGAMSPTPPTTTPSPTPPSSRGSSSLRNSFEDLRPLSLSTSSSGPLTPKPSHTPEVALAPRASTPISPAQSPQPYLPNPSHPKSPPIISANPPSNGGVLVPTKGSLSTNNLLSSPSKPTLGSLNHVGSPSFDSPARAVYSPMSPPIPHRRRGMDNDEESSRPVPRRYSEPPPVDLNLMFPEIAKAKDKNKKSDVLAPAMKYMQAAMTHLEQNAIAASLGNLDLCASLLATLPEETSQELEYCIRYRMFLVLLKEIAKPKPPAEHAFLSFFLTDIAVKPHHRVIAIRMAVRHNMTSLNFGIAAGLLQFLIERLHPVDENALQEKLRKCMSQNRSNADPRFKKYTCPGCEATSSVSAMKCNPCQQPIKLCALTLDIITTKAYYSCKLCKLNFARKSISARDYELKCPFCKVGDLANKAFVTSK